MPQGTGSKGHEAGAEAGLLAAGGDAQVDVVAEPVVGVDVPAAEVASRVLGRLDGPGVNVLQAVPRDPARGGVHAVVAQAGEDAGALGQVPDAVVLEARREAHHVEGPDPAGEAVPDERVGRQHARVVGAAEGHEEADEDEAAHGLPGGGPAAPGDLPPLPDGGLLGRVDGVGDVKHGGVEPPAVVGVVKGRAGEEGREEEDPSGVVEEPGQLREPVPPLGVGQVVVGELSVGDVPAKGAQLHEEHHLGARDVDARGVVGDLAVDVVDRHVAHDKGEADPWHVRARAEEPGDAVGAAGADEEGADAGPEVEQADEVEEGDAGVGVSLGVCYSRDSFCCCCCCT